MLSRGSKIKQTLEQRGQSRSALYIQKLKETNPEKYKLHLAKEAERNKKARKELSEEQKEAQREKTRFQVQKLREKRKLENKNETRTPFKKKIKDMSKEELKDYNRVRKAESRLKMSHQKKTRVREREKKYKQNRKALQVKETFSPSNFKEIKKLSSNSHSPSPSTRVLTSRIRKKLPKSPSKYAYAIKKFISNCSPRKKLALETLGIHSPTKIQSTLKIVNQIKNEANKIKIKRRVIDIKMLKMLKNITNQTALKVIKRAKKNSTGTLYKHKLFKIPRSKIEDFYKRGDISRPIPVKKSVKNFKVLYLMETTICNAWMRYNEEYPADYVSYASFARMRPKNVKITGSKDLITCMCEYCANILQKLDALRRFPQKKKGPNFPKVPTTVFELNELTMCKPKTLLCAERECAKCKFKIETELFKKIEECCGTDEIKWIRYEKTERKVLKTDLDDGVVEEIKKVKDYVPKCGKMNVMLNEFREELKTFGMHLFNAMWQLEKFNSLINNLEEGCLVTVEDFSENFHVKYQLTPQSAYWDMQSFSLHPTVCFYRDPDTSEIVREGVTLVTPDQNHDYFAAAVFRRTTVNHILEKRNIKIKQHIGWSDGCSSQYKCCGSFLEYSLYPQVFSHSYEHHFFGSRHAKGPSDAEGAVVKTWVDRQIAHGALVQSAEDFVKICQTMPPPKCNPLKKFKTKREVILVEHAEIDQYRIANKQQVKVIKGIRKIHSACSTVETAGILTLRNRSCFCTCCKMNEDCKNKEAGEKKIVSLLNNPPKPNTEFNIGDWCFVIYNENLWPGVIENIISENNSQTFSISFLTPQGDVSCNRFRYPTKKDTALHKYEDILLKVPSPPHPITSRGDFSFDKEIIDLCISKMN